MIKISNITCFEWKCIASPQSFSLLFTIKNFFYIPSVSDAWSELDLLKGRESVALYVWQGLWMIVKRGGPWWWLSLGIDQVDGGMEGWTHKKESFVPTLTVTSKKTATRVNLALFNKESKVSKDFFSGNATFHMQAQSKGGGLGLRGNDLAGLFVGLHWRHEYRKH